MTAEWITSDEPEDRRETHRRGGLMQNVRRSRFFPSLYSRMNRERFLFPEADESGYPNSVSVYREEGRDEYRNSSFDMPEGNREERQILREISLHLSAVKELLGEDWRLDVE